LAKAQRMDEAMALLRAADREAWLALLWAPASLRPPLAAALALDLELERVVAELSEPLLAEIRLAWWRERLAELARGAAPPPQPLLRALAGAGRPAGLDLVALAELEDSLLPLLGARDPELAAVAAHRGAALAGALQPLIGPGAGPALARRAMARFARRSWRNAARIARGLTGWCAGPAAGFEQADAPPRLLAGLDALARADLVALRGGRPLARAAGPARQLALARAAFRLSPRAGNC
jgi:phytoene synthase